MPLTPVIKEKKLFNYVSNDRLVDLDVGTALTLTFDLTLDLSHDPT